MKKLIPLFILILALGVSAQVKKAVKPTPKPPIIEIEATTKDGKAVILSSDGTWRYNENSSIQPTSSKTSSSSSVLNIEAALVFQSGDVKPIARTDFYLLPDNVENIIGTTDLLDLFKQDADKGGYSTTLRQTNTRSLIGAIYKYQTLYPTYSAAATDALLKSVKYKTTSDFNGKASFTNVPPGQYILFAVASTPKSFAFWNMKVELTSQPLNLILDQKNAESAY